MNPELRIPSEEMDAPAATRGEWVWVLLLAGLAGCTSAPRAWSANTTSTVEMMRPATELDELVHEARLLKQNAERLYRRLAELAEREALRPKEPETAAASPQENLIRNGGFERPDVGYGWHDIGPGGGKFVWTVTPAKPGKSWRVEVKDGFWSGVSQQGRPGVSDQSADIDFHTILSQEIRTEIGRRYRLSFWYAHNPDGGNRSSRGVVRVMGNTILQFAELTHAEPSTLEDMMFKQHVAEFTADSLLTRLELEGLTGSIFGFVVDDVTVVPVAPPRRPEVPTPAPEDDRLAEHPVRAEFQSHLYQIFRGDVSWHEAKQHCEKLNGHLAIIDSKGENDFIHSLRHDRERLYLGATDEKEEGEWLWVNGEAMVVPEWTRFNCDNAHGGQHYLIMWHGGTWDDECLRSGLVDGFVCEWDTSGEIVPP